MKRNRTALIILIAIILVAGVVYLLPGRGDEQTGQPSPHAINQTN